MGCTGGGEGSSAQAAPKGGAPGASAPSATASTSIDRTNFDQIEKAGPESLQKLAKMRVFFAHASVGGNIVQGLQALNQSDPSRYPLKVTQAGGAPSGPGAAGGFYELDRGNPGQAAKITQFAEAVNSGWSSPNVDVVINKFCYIDPDADFAAYTSSMVKLEKDHPGTIVIFTTIPICADQSNDQREEFNEKLREWAKTNHKLLLDIADIEAGQADRSARTYPSQGRQVRQMVQDYTSDGGHLNEAGSKRVAEGLYSLLVSVAG